MASGKVVGLIGMAVPPGSSRANPGIRQGGSTPAENIPIVSFDDASTEYWDFLCALEGYDGQGLTISFAWAAATATSGNVVWGMALRRFEDDAEDVDSSHSYAFNTTTAGAASASGELSYDTITFTDGADMDSVADGERFLLRVERVGGDGSDTMSGDAELLLPLIAIRET